MRELIAPAARRVVTLIGRRWSLPILMALQGNVLRNHQLRHVVSGVSDKVLVETLRALEDAGLVRRQVYTEVPLRVEYGLTDASQALLHLLAPLNDWAAAYGNEKAPLEKIWAAAVGAPA